MDWIQEAQRLFHSPKPVHFTNYRHCCGCVPPFTHGVFTGLYDSRGQLCFVNTTVAKSNLPSACSPALGGGTLVLCLAGMSGRLSIIVPCRYPLRHVSHGKPTVVKGGRWRLPCRCSLHRLSPRYTRTPLWARPLRMERRLSSLICASTTFNRSWGRRRRSIGARHPTMSMCMNCRRSTIR